MLANVLEFAISLSQHTNSTHTAFRWTMLWSISCIVMFVVACHDHVPVSHEACSMHADPWCDDICHDDLHSSHPVSQAAMCWWLLPFCFRDWWRKQMFPIEQQGRTVWQVWTSILSLPTCSMEFSDKHISLLFSTMSSVLSLNGFISTFLFTHEPTHSMHLKMWGSLHTPQLTPKTPSAMCNGWMLMPLPTFNPDQWTFSAMQNLNFQLIHAHFIFIILSCHGPIVRHFLTLHHWLLFQPSHHPLFATPCIALLSM